MSNEEEFIELFERLEDEHSYGDPMIEPKFEAQQVCAVMLLYDKLKPENKKERYFFQGEHDILYIGSGFDIFEDFTEEDIRKAISYGIGLNHEGGEGFQIYASM